MAIWSSEIKELEKLHESLKGQLPDLEKELGRLIKADDENMILLYSRRCLEVIITDLCECELKRPRKTEPLKGIIDKLNKEEKVPSHIITSMHGLNELSTYGAHPKDFDPEQLKPVLVNLDIIIKWYLKYKGSAVIFMDESQQEKDSTKLTEVPTEVIRPPKKNLVLILTSILLIIAVLVFPKIFRRKTLEEFRSSGERISVAVMPFQNMVNDTTWDDWQDGIQFNLISYLSNFPEELAVRQTESVTNILQGKGLTNYASITPSIASEISQKLDANVFINGNISQSGSIIRLNAQLVDSKTGEVFKSFQIDGAIENIFDIIDSLSIMVKNILVISKLGKELSPEFLRFASINSSEAFRYFKSAQNAFNERDWATAVKLYSQALDIDSNFIFAPFQLVYAYGNQGLYSEAKKYALNLYEKRDEMSLPQQTIANLAYAIAFQTPYEQIKCLKQALEFDDQSPSFHFGIGLAYRELDQYYKAITEYEKALEIYKKWDIIPSWTGVYSHLGFLYHKTGQSKKEKKLYKKAEMDFPDNSDLMERHAVMSLSEGDINSANRYIDKYISIRKEKSVPEASITGRVAGIYSEAGILDRSEEYYRKALLLEPDNPIRINSLAYFLIDKDKNVNEGMELVDKALSLRSDHYELLNTKGWGLYKQGKYQEALEILQKSWDLRRQNAFYDHEAFLHLEAAKKAVAN